MSVATAVRINLKFLSLRVTVTVTAGTLAHDPAIAVHDPAIEFESES